MPEKKESSKTGNKFATIFLIIGVVGFQIVAPQIFERPPGGGINTVRLFWAAVVGGGSAMIGYLIGAAIEKNSGK